MYGRLEIQLGKEEKEIKKKKKHGENGHADGVREMNCPYSERSVV